MSKSPQLLSVNTWPYFYTGTLVLKSSIHSRSQFLISDQFILFVFVWLIEHLLSMLHAFIADELWFKCSCTLKRLCVKHVSRRIHRWWWVPLSFIRSTRRAIFEKVSNFTAFGLKTILNYFKPENYLYISNGFILNLPARNTENIVPATLQKSASRIKHWYTEALILRKVRKSIFLDFVR